MMQTYQVANRFPPIHYYPNEFTIVLHCVRFRKPYLAKLFHTNIEGCYICHSECNCIDMGPIEIHHIIPINDLGNNCNKNLIPLCFKHHQDIHNNLNIKMTAPTSINIRLIKKTRKLMIKFWNQNPHLSRLNQNRDFINVHLIIDDTIKYCIHHKILDKLIEYTSQLYHNGTIKSKPKY